MAGRYGASVAAAPRRYYSTSLAASVSEDLSAAATPGRCDTSATAMFDGYDASAVTASGRHSPPATAVFTSWDLSACGRAREVRRLRHGHVRWSRRFGRDHARET